MCRTQTPFTSEAQCKCNTYGKQNMLEGHQIISLNNVIFILKVISTKMNILNTNKIKAKVNLRKFMKTKISKD